MKNLRFNTWLLPFSIALLFSIAPLTPMAKTFHVPDDSVSIQAAIDAAANGDLVLVSREFL